MPFIIGLLVFTVIPFFTSLYLAFTDYNVLTTPKWIGLDNFKRMFFEDKLFWKAFWVTFRFAFIQIPIKLLVSLGVALVLSRNTKATGCFRRCLPHRQRQGANLRCTDEPWFKPLDLHRPAGQSRFPRLGHAESVLSRAGQL